jgi:hypothetical protein
LPCFKNLNLDNNPLEAKSVQQLILTLSSTMKKTF